jgi:hypothetical protein
VPAPIVLLDIPHRRADAALRGDRVAAVRACMAAVPGVRSIAVEPGSNGPALRYLVEADQRASLAQDLAAALVGRGLALAELAPASLDLERIFLQLTRPPTEEEAA